MRYGRHLSLVLFTFLAPIQAAQIQEGLTSRNPIDQVVHVLKDMEAKVQKEGQDQQNAYDAFICNCKTQIAAYKKSIEADKDRLPQLRAAFDEDTATKTSLIFAMKKQQEQRSADEASIAEAKPIREKKAQEAYDLGTRLKSNIRTIRRTLKEFDNGHSASFLQDPDISKILNRIAEDKDLFERIDSQASVDFTDASSDPRDVFIAFIEGKHGDESPEADQVKGILKQMAEDFEKDLKESEAKEAADRRAYDDIIATKFKRIEVADKAIAAIRVRKGDLGLSIQANSADYRDTEKAVADDRELLESTQEECAQRTRDHAKGQALIAEALSAITETIRFLVLDPNLEIMRHTIKTREQRKAARAAQAKAVTGPYFLQLKMSSLSASKQQALKIVHSASQQKQTANVEFIALALQGKECGIEDVIWAIKQIEETLASEQRTDDRVKKMCTEEKDENGLKKLKQDFDIGRSDTALSTKQSKVDSLQEDIPPLKEELATLEQRLKAAKQQRAEEYAAYAKEKGAILGAKAVLLKAETKLNKFYDKEKYRESMHQGAALVESAPLDPNAPNTYNLKARTVVELMRRLTKILDNQMLQLNIEWQDRARTFKKKIGIDETISESMRKRLQRKEAMLLASEQNLEEIKLDRSALLKEVKALDTTMANVAKKCDWLLANYELRERARYGEIKSMEYAKDKLTQVKPDDWRAAGMMDFVQVKQRRKFLSRHV